MIAWSIGILIYALILRLSKNSDMIPHSYASKENGPEYTKDVSKILIAVALAPLVSGVTALRFPDRIEWAFIVLITGFILCIPYGIQLVKDEKEDLKEQNDNDKLNDTEIEDE